MTLPITKNKNGVQFAVTLQPRSSRNEITGLHNDTLKIKLTAPPVDGAANTMCLKFLGKTLGVSPSQLSIVSGATSRNKVICIEGMNESALIKKLEPHLPSSEKK